MRISLRVKASLLVAFAAVLLSVVSVVCYNNATQDFVVGLYSERSVDLARTTSASIDAERVRHIRDEVLETYEQLDERVSNDELGTPELDAYAAQFAHITQTEDYKTVLNQLRTIQDQNKVECIYLLWPHEEDGVAIYLADASYEDQCLPGQFDYFTEHDHEVFDNPQAGIPADVTHTVWGWVVASGMPVYSHNEIVGYATNDFSMDDIMAKQRALLFTVVAAIALITALLAVVAIFFVNRLVIGPVQVLTDAAMESLNEGVDVTRTRFENLNIHTHDELETLADTMAEMERAINEHIKDLTATTEELVRTRSRANEMSQIASLDGLTKTFNKRAYGIETQKLDDAIEAARLGVSAMPKFAIVMIDLNYLKRINDTYGHDKGDAAILALVDLIRSIFDGCATYRLGGDEFAVLLHDDQCARAGGLTAQVKGIMDERSQTAARQALQAAASGAASGAPSGAASPTSPNATYATQACPWEQVSAAVGYAVFDADEDADADAVLRRADKAMYAHKASMKAIRI